MIYINFIIILFFIIIIIKIYIELKKRDLKIKKIYIEYLSLEKMINKDRKAINLFKKINNYQFKELSGLREIKRELKCFNNKSNFYYITKPMILKYIHLIREFSFKELREYSIFIKLDNRIYGIKKEEFYDINISYFLSMIEAIYGEVKGVKK